MPRPFKQRRVSHDPGVSAFKPVGYRYRDLEEVVLTVDELEALRLTHLEGYYQVAVAKAMGVSRPTAGRILESAHRKMTDALVNTRVLKIAGGPYETAPETPRCPRCGDRKRRRQNRQVTCCGKVIEDD